MIEFLANFLLLFGATFLFLGTLGVIKLPDTLCRSHSLTIAMTLGVCSMLTGLGLHLGGMDTGWKIALIIFLQLTTIPISSHLLAYVIRRIREPQKTLRSWKEPPSL